MCARTRTLSRGCVQSIRSRLVAAGSGARRAPSSRSRRLNASIERRCRFSCRRRANREPRGRLRERRSQSFTTVLETTTTMTVRHGCCHSVVATARVQRRTRDKVTLGLLLPVVSRARMRSRREDVRASERARRRESEEYEGKSRRERDKTKRGKKYESDKGKRKKTSLDLFLIDC